MLKLGQQHRLILTVVRHGEESEVILIYRDPKPSEWVAYNAATAAFVTRLPRDGTTLEPAVHAEVLAGLGAARAELGSAVLVDAEGVEPPEGMTRADAVRQHDGELVLHLGKHVADSGGVRAPLGKSETPSA